MAPTIARFRGLADFARPPEGDGPKPYSAASVVGGDKARSARALYRRPKLLVMDEGTSHLDTKHESAVNAAISSLGITRIGIAHRKETIAAAERIYLMTNGKLDGTSVDQGPTT